MGALQAAQCQQQQQAHDLRYPLIWIVRLAKMRQPKHERTENRKSGKKKCERGHGRVELSIRLLRMANDYSIKRMASLGPGED